jgi:REP element-mobilizing transposase RayT
VAHGVREAFSAGCPLHVTLRVVDDVRGLRRGRVMRALRRVLWAFHETHGDVSVVEYAVMQDHLHLIVEATDAATLARGMQGLMVRLARAINGLFGRRGRVFADRYHVHVLRTPREVRHALVYVLHNARKHAPHSHRAHAPAIDPCSTAAWFHGYADLVRADTQSLARALALGPPGTRAARTWLLRIGWRRAGMIGLAEVPSLH